MKPVIAFVTGGYSTEAEVSYKSAINIEKNIDPNKYEVFKIDITPEGWWYVTSTGRKIAVDRGDFSISADGRKVIFDAC
jgi:D-alanine-D-alanine ligase